MLSLFRTKHLNNQRGISHHFILPVLAVVAVGGIGAYLTFASRADTVISGRMAYSSYISSELKWRKGTITSDGRLDRPYDGSIGFTQTSLGNHWILGQNKYNYYALSEDYSKLIKLPVETLGDSYCDAGEEKIYKYSVRFVPEVSVTIPPRIAVIRTQYDCVRRMELNTKFYSMKYDGSEIKELMYDSRDKVGYTFGSTNLISLVEGDGVTTSGGALLIKATPVEGQNYRMTEPIYVASSGRIAPLAGCSGGWPRISKDGKRVVCRDWSRPNFSIYNTYGTLLSTTTIPSRQVGNSQFEPVAINYDGSKIVFRKFTLPGEPTQTESLWVYDVATKKSKSFDSGTREKNKAAFVFHSVSFSSSGSFIGYTKRDAKYQSNTIRRIRADGTQGLVTKTLQFDSENQAIVLW